MAGKKSLSAAVFLVLVCGALAFSASSATNTVATVNVGRTNLGAILVDGSGRTLYLFTLDLKNSSSCTTGSFNCLAVWHPLMTTGKPHAGPGVNPALLVTFRRTKPSGLQVSYNGHPLYTFNQDAAAGDVSGQGYGTLWYVVSPKGKAIKTK